jgi:hypothetical protein
MSDDDPILRNPEAVAAIAIRAFAKAKAKAIAENDRLGVPSYGADEQGRIVVRQPPRAGSHVINQDFREFRLTE